MIKKVKKGILAIVLGLLSASLAGAYSVDMQNGHLVDGNGMTLYYFINDGPGNGISTCYGSCSLNWPPFYSSYITVPDNLNSNDFRTIRREDGKMQTTYHNWPIYYYSGDQNAGDARGNGMDGLWSSINPNSFP
jgi:predicted lipoprotein with Yx(FWY)xxD motif